MRLILFEFKKIIHNKIYLFFLLLTILIISSLFIRNYTQQDIIPTKKIEVFSEYKDEVHIQISEDKKLLEKGPNQEVETRLNMGYLLSNQLSQLIQSIEDRKWKGELKSEITVYKSAINFQNIEGKFSLNKSDMKKNMDLNLKLLELGLPKEDLALSIQPSLFMKKVISLLLNTPGYILLLVILGSYITKEHEEHNIKLIYTLPINRSRYILVKFISLFIAAFLWLVTLFFTAYLIPTAFKGSVGIPSFGYPLVNKYGDFIYAGMYLEQAILYSICFIAFSIALIVFIAFLSKKSIVMYIMTFILFTGSLIISNSGFNSFGNPFTYQYIDKIILDIPSYYPNGMATLLIACVVFLVLVISINRKRGI